VYTVESCDPGSEVGDQLDRGGDEVAILYMLERLRREAREAGGELIVMNGGAVQVESS
jgi:hypothetical protein